MKWLWILFLLVGISGCKKYQDGPWLSLATKKSRLVNTWQVNEAIDRLGLEVTAQFQGYSFQFEGDGSAQVIFPNPIDPDTLEGTWNWMDEKEILEWVLTGDTTFFLYGARASFDILRLKSGELWLADPENTKIYLEPLE